MVNCNRGCCFWLFFGLSMLAITGYLMYLGWWIPIEIHKHRLRYNQLNSFEIYNMNINQWNKYNMDKEEITIISYLQHIPYKYQYFIGALIDGGNISNHNESQLLINLSWNNFSDLINENRSLASNLYIMQYSQTKCNDFKQCFQDFINQHYQEMAEIALNVDNNNIDDVDESVLIYTQIENEYKAKIDSELTSKILDDTRDGFQFIITFILCIWFILVLEFFDDNDSEIGEAWMYLLITIFFAVGYYLYILTLSFIPILFSYPIYLNGDLDYWEQNRYSITYTVGHYNASWWISGVLIHGIWQWSIVLICPLCCCIYIMLLLFCCCNDSKADKIGKFIAIPLIIIGCLVIALSTVAFYPLFIGNVIQWNSKTFPDLNDINNKSINDGYDNQNIIILQLLIGIGLLIIIIPIFACILTIITKYIEREREENTRGIHSVKRSFKKLPVVNGLTNTDGKTTRYGKVELGGNGYDDENYDVYN